MCFDVSVSKVGTITHGFFSAIHLFSIVFILWVIWANKFSLYAKILLTHKSSYLIAIYLFFVCPLKRRTKTQ
jgi:hypothetical protein